jgi:hypothetical protein
MQNVQNLLCFLDRSTFFWVIQKMFVKKEEKWAKGTLWAADQKDPFTDIN